MGFIQRKQTEIKPKIIAPIAPLKRLPVVRQPIQPIKKPEVETYEVEPAEDSPKVEEEVIEEEEEIEESKVVNSQPVKKVVPGKKEEKHRWVVVKEIPTQIVRETISEDGTILHFVTIEEALTQVINQ